MNKVKILNKVYQQKLDVETAYRKLFQQPKVKIPKSRFVKVKINIKDHPYVTGFMKLFTLLPLPTALIKFFIKKSIYNNLNFSTEDLLKIVSMKHISLSVWTEDATINIKTI